MKALRKRGWSSPVFSLLFRLLVVTAIGVLGGFACSKDGSEDKCPNGHVDPGEECDFGGNSNQSVCYNVNGYYSCLCSCSVSTCKWDYRSCTNCGDGVCQADEGDGGTCPSDCNGIGDGGI